MSEVGLITSATIEALVGAARAAARRRKNLNLHARNEDSAQRLLNAIEPDSYVRPHRHLDPAKDETIIALAGRIGILIFSASGDVTGRYVLQPAGPTRGITIPAGAFHTVLGLDPGSVMFEAKAGPYRGNDDNELAAFAPAEGDAGCEGVLARWRAGFGQAVPHDPGSDAR